MGGYGKASGTLASKTMALDWVDWVLCGLSVSLSLSLWHRVVIPQRKGGKGMKGMKGGKGKGKARWIEQAVTCGRLD